MVKSSKSKSEDKRKPKHGLDASRPSKGGKNQRDAATVRMLSTCNQTCCSLLAVLEANRPQLTLATFFPQGGSIFVQVRRLQMYKKTAKRDKKGKIIQQVHLKGSE